MNLEKSVVVAILDPEVRSRVKGYLEDWMFENNLLRCISKTLCSEKFDGRPINKTMFLLTLKAENPNLTDQDLQETSHILDEYSGNCDLEQALPAVTSFIKDQYRARAISLYSEGEAEKGDFFYSKVMNFGIESEFTIDPSNVAEVIREKKKDIPIEGKELRSSIALVNTSLLYGGYKPGDLIMVCAAPKSGKSSFLVQEGSCFIRQGFKILHVMVGDMSIYDAVVRYLACLTGKTQQEVILNTEEMVESNKETLSLLRVGATPALSRTIFEILSEARRIKQTFDYQALIIDYDSNILVPKSESLYEFGGILYSTLKGFAQKECVTVFVASQPKIQYWQDELVSGAAAAESSRKQAAVDLMITIGRNRKCRQVGILHIPYARRGESGQITRVKFEDKICRITQIDVETYKTIVENYSESMSRDPDYLEQLFTEISEEKRRKKDDGR